MTKPELQKLDRLLVKLQALRARLQRFHQANPEGPTATALEILDALDVAEAEIARLRENIDVALDGRDKTIEQLRDQITARDAAPNELLEVLREAWRVPDVDAMTLFLSAFVGGLRDEWLKAHVQNGVVHSLTFPDIGKVQIEIRRVDGKSAAESLKEYSDENARLSRQAELHNDELERIRDVVATECADMCEPLPVAAKIRKRFKLGRAE